MFSTTKSINCYLLLVGSLGRCRYPIGDGGGVSATVDPRQALLVVVPGEDGWTLASPNVEPVGDDSFGVVGSMLDRGSRSESRCDLTRGNFERDDELRDGIRLREHVVQRSGLVDGAGDAVEDPAARLCRGGQRSRQHGEHVLDGDQIASRGRRRYSAPDLGVVRNLSPHQCTDRDVGRALPRSKKAGLGSLPGTGRSQHDCPYHVVTTEL